MIREDKVYAIFPYLGQVSEYGEWIDLKALDHNVQHVTMIKGKEWLQKNLKEIRNRVADAVKKTVEK